jgi:prepilin-type N-terminal cleavage/methylation domain-containing protein
MRRGYSLMELIVAILLLTGLMGGVVLFISVIHWLWN